MNKRFLPITIATSLLLLTALGGYLIPPASDEIPVRVLLDNKGGKVILTHTTHVKTLGHKCNSCHHTTGNDSHPPACSGCHTTKFDTTFRTEHQKMLDKKLCASCHHPTADINRFLHDEHADDYTGGDCQSCHHDESIETKPESCSNCHAGGSNAVSDLRDAVHERCADCHLDMYQNGIKGCSNCHERKQGNAGKTKQHVCSTCHNTPVDQLVPTTMNAFHGQCMHCHKKKNAGPAGDDACYQCHMR